MLRVVAFMRRMAAGAAEAAATPGGVNGDLLQRYCPPGSDGGPEYGGQRCSPGRGRKR
jgi:hypothetical protein